MKGAHRRLPDNVQDDYDNCFMSKMIAFLALEVFEPSSFFTVYAHPHFYKLGITSLPLSLLFGLSFSDIWTWHDSIFLVTNIETLCDTHKHTLVPGLPSTCSN